MALLTTAVYDTKSMRRAQNRTWRSIRENTSFIGCPLLVWRAALRHIKSCMVIPSADPPTASSISRANVLVKKVAPLVKKVAPVVKKVAPIVKKVAPVVQVAAAPPVGNLYFGDIYFWFTHM